eukprot:6409111-Prymnesium_polylepis.1
MERARAHGVPGCDISPHRPPSRHLGDWARRRTAFCMHISDVNASRKSQCGSRNAAEKRCPVALRCRMNVWRPVVVGTSCRPPGSAERF